MVVSVAPVSVNGSRAVLGRPPSIGTKTCTTRRRVTSPPTRRNTTGWHWRPPPPYGRTTKPDDGAYDHGCSTPWCRNNKPEESRKASYMMAARGGAADIISIGVGDAYDAEYSEIP